MANLIVSAVSTFDNKGLKKGRKEVSAFEKQVKSFAKVFAAAFSAQKLLNYSKQAVKAFMADEKAAKSLEQQLKNTGYQFSAPGVELYIANLQKATGVVDDELRPAFQQLLTVTESITTSQDALNTALDISAGTGKSLSQVTAALSRAYAGNTTGLSRLGAGLDKALLKAGDMDAIMAELNNKFAGQSAARLKTYAGQMDLLRVASQNAQEIIGKGLLDAITSLSDDNTIENLSSDMEDFATATSEVIVGLGQVAAKLKAITTIPGLGSIFDVANIPVIGAYIGGLRQIGRNVMSQQDRGGQERTAARIAALQRKQEIRNIREINTLRKDEITQLKAKTAVDKLKDQFDIERIGLTKALNETTDAETKLRLQAKIAILDNNEALAKKLLAELEAAKAALALAEAARKAVEALGTFDPSRFRRGEEASMEGLSILSVLAALGAVSGGLDNEITGTLGGSIFDPSFVRRGESKDLTITVDVAQSGDRFAALIAESIQVATKSGISYGVAGGL
jgi:hypothetical protein